MATVVLQYAGAALGTFLGGPLGGIIGRALGGIAGNIVDQRLFGSATHHEGPQLGSLRVMSSEEGAPIPVVFGRMRIAGQVIWASNLVEMASTTTQKTSSKGGPQATSTDYTYFANFAVGLCEGEIDGIGRVWADGKEIDLESFNPRIYKGTETQTPDSLIIAIEEAAPAYRGLSYVVFERFALAQFGNRLPQLTFEMIGKGNAVAGVVKALNIIPGSTEFGYDTQVISRNLDVGITASENAHVSAERSDWSVSIDQLQATCENVAAISLVVSWFGNDLRCGTCQLKPMVDNAVKNTSPTTWMVNGISRELAQRVSQVNGGPAYAGTPSDASVKRAIQDAHSRGLKVTFYPFILMDIPATNNLADPYGGSQQAAYPWRGRITASVAPGRVGTPDKTAVATSEISAFVGNALPSDFTTSGDTVVYSGPAEWSFRRMILHYAKLCAAAGGVDAFLIGSEMPGLSTLRASTSNFPFVTALQSLAVEVKVILPEAKISYAADWSEYSGHRPSDGSGDLYFHLDSLWSSSAIDFIGIDNYAPISDWRDGTAHADYMSGTNSIYDQTYLQAGCASGENYDWYYANTAARDVQLRSPITDGTYGKPWVYRAKDFKSWWLNEHYNRPAGVQSASPTPWVPQSKPIWFTEAGCPAIDKGTNEPNVFYDIKSAESSLPHYSGGQADAQIQTAYIKAVQSYWSSTNNPVSSVYGSSMVDTSKIFYWAWDARPFPAFPTLTTVWSDTANYARGHWLNGRIGAVSLGELISRLALRFGFAEIDVSEVDGQIDGYVLDRPMSARDALENLLTAFAIDVVETEGKLKFRSRKTASAITLSVDDLVEEGAEKAIFSQTRAQQTELPASVRLGYIDAGLDYRTAAVSQMKQHTGSAREINISLPAAVNQAEAQARVDVMLEEAWAAREHAEFSVPPQFLNFEPGDVIEIGSSKWRVKSIADGGARKISAVAHEPAVYDPAPAASRLAGTTLPPIYGPPDVVLLDLGLVTSGSSAAPWFAAQASPWPGSLALYKKTGAASFTFIRLISGQATMATSLNPWPQGRLHRIDFTAGLDVVMRFGAFTSISEDELLNGKNLVAIGDAATGYEVAQFLNAELIATNTFRLTGWLRGQAGSEPEMLASRTTGTNIVLLNTAVVQPELSASEIGLETTWRLGPAQLDHGHASFIEFTFTSQQRALRPLSPVQIKSSIVASGVQLTWIRRSRIDADSWDVAEISVGEVAEIYTVEIFDGSVLKRCASVTTPNYIYTASDILADFGLTPASFTVRIAQVSSLLGAGAFLERTINV
jgi:GTA TIM-barrel-like domain/Putative phage tail protein